MGSGTNQITKVIMLEIIFEELQHVASQFRGMDRERDGQTDGRKTYRGGDDG